MAIEIWKPVKGYEGIYEVSSMGNVKSIFSRRTGGRELILSPMSMPTGYKYVNLYKDGKAVHRYVHRLVADVFLPNPDALPEVNHKNENPGDNRVDNLEWCTSQYNKNYGNRAKRMAEAKKDRFTGENAVRRSPVVCVETGKTYATMREAAKDTGVNYNKISLCCSGKRGTTGGYHWRYAKEVIP